MQRIRICLQLGLLVAVLLGFSAADTRPRFVTEEDFDSNDQTFSFQQPPGGVDPRNTTKPYTPEDGQVIAVEMGVDYKITVIGEYRGKVLIRGEEYHDTESTGTVVWQEAPSFRGPDPIAIVKSIFPGTGSDGESVEDNEVPGLEVVGTQDTAGTLFKGEYTFTPRKVGSLEGNMVCFRLVTCEIPGTRDDAGNDKCIGTWSYDEELQQTTFQLDPIIYLQRCVHIHVLANPSIVSVSAVDSRHQVRDSVFETSPGQPVRIRVRAMDPNDDDDVDVMIAAPTMPGSQQHMVGLGLRMCCNHDWEECEPRRFIAQDCEDDCVWNCSSMAPGAEDNWTRTDVISTCVEECAHACERHPCRYIQRDFLVPGTLLREEDMMLRFKATDDSGRLDGRTINLMSEEVGVTVKVIFTPDPKFVDSTPPHGTRFRIVANCPMPAIGVAIWAPADSSNFELLPEGCENGTKVRGELCTQQSCAAEAMETGCCCATEATGSSAGVSCPVCLPEAPPGFEISKVLDHPWKTMNESGVERAYMPYYILAANVCPSDMGAQNLRIWSNGWIASGSHIRISGIMVMGGSNISVSAHIEMMALEVAGFDVMGGNVVLRVPRGFMASREVMITIMVSGHGSPVLNLMYAMVELNGQEAEMGEYPVATTQPANISGCNCFYNCSTVYGMGMVTGMDGMPMDGGVSKQRILRWTPGIEHMGQTHTVCLEAITVTNNSEAGLFVARVNGDRRCYHFEVIRCRFCVGDGDTIQTIAGEFGGNWLQIWSSNQMQGTHPDAIATGQVLHMGPVHVISETRKLSDLALDMATTEKSLRVLNRDIPEDQEWVGRGREICVMPGICDSSVALDGTGREQQ